jgi:transposase
MQFREGLSDRQAADAVRGRIDWKYLLALDLADAGFDFSVLCEFRGRLLQHAAAERLLARLLDAARGGGLLKARGRSRTDSTHVLAAVRHLNRLELVGETLRAALNALAVAVADWLRAVAPPDWHERYDRRVEDMRLPDTGPKRDAYAVQVGMDGFALLDALDRADAPPDARALSEVAVLRRVWARHFERIEAGSGDGTTGGQQAGGRVRMRPVQGRPTCMRRRVRDQFTMRLLQNAWSRPSTWWTPPASAPATSSPPARSTTSTWSAPGGAT